MAGKKNRNIKTCSRCKDGQHGECFSPYCRCSFCDRLIATHLDFNFNDNQRKRVNEINITLQDVKNAIKQSNKVLSNKKEWDKIFKHY